MKCTLTPSIKHNYYYYVYLLIIVSFFFLSPKQLLQLINHISDIHQRTIIRKKGMNVLAKEHLYFNFYSIKNDHLFTPYTVQYYSHMTIIYSPSSIQLINYSSFLFRLSVDRNTSVVGGFEQQAAGAVLDMMGDEDYHLKKSNSIMRWYECIMYTCTVIETFPLYWKMVINMVINIY